MIDTAGGTPEEVWRDDPHLQGAPPQIWGEPGRVLAIAPHPDDEVLGIGGTLRQLAAAGHEIELVAVTEGEASHPGSVALSGSALARARRDEATAARHRLGLVDCPVHRLHLPDGEVAGHLLVLSAALTELAWPEGIVLATWREDGHPDHDATGRAAATAAAERGSRLFEYPVWLWNWARPGDPRVPWARLRATGLDRATRQAKSEAIAEFRTQVEPIGPGPADGPVLPPGILDHHLRRTEVVFT